MREVVGMAPGVGRPQGQDVGQWWWVGQGGCGQEPSPSSCNPLRRPTLMRGQSIPPHSGLPAGRKLLINLLSDFNIGITFPM